MEKLVSHGEVVKPFTASMALGGRTWAPEALQGSGGCGAQCPQQMSAGMCPHYRGELIHKLEVLL